MSRNCSCPNAWSPCIEAGTKSTLSLGPAAKPSSVTNSCRITFLIGRLRDEPNTSSMLIEVISGHAAPVESGSCAGVTCSATILVMNLKKYLLAVALIVLLLPAEGLAQPNAARDGQHDFDFEIGTWTTHVRRRLRPLTGSSTWVEMKGTSVVRKVWNGRGNLVELTAEGPEGRFEGLSLRLYNPESRQWSLNFANSRDGIL